MRIHLVAPVPHRDIVDDWEPDAYVGKVLRLATMLTRLGHDVHLYAGPRTDAEVAELVTVVTDDDRHTWFGDETWDETVFNEFDPAHPSWAAVNARTAAAITDRLEPTDLIFLTMGSAQAPIRQAFPGHVVAECGVGYEGVVPGTHRCYESLAWMHWIWGRTGVSDGRFFDTVIPNFFSPDDYEPSGFKDDYLLFMARNTPRKGVEVVAELAKHHRVVTAGQGGPIPGCEHAGVVKGAEKARLLARARALISYSLYVEPFGGVAAEAMLCGTPVIATPFGAYSETVADGETGFLCHTLAEVLAAAKRVDRLDGRAIRQRALARFTVGAAAPRYDRWIERLATLYDRGWYACT